MSTHSMIGIENKDGSIDAIYCHSDGYIKHVGWYLYTFYNNAPILKALISLGDISRIGPKIGGKIDFYKFSFDTVYHRNNNQVLAYHRDRGEELSIHHYKDKSDYTKSTCDYSYVYLFTKGEWRVKNWGEKGRFCSLEKRLSKNKELMKYYSYYVEDEERNFTTNERCAFKAAYEQLNAIK